MDVLSRPERQEVTTRTLPKLFIQILLVTRQWREYYSNVDTWLASLPQARQDSLVRFAMNNSLAKLIKDKWPDSHGYRAETHALDIGYTRRVKAIHSGEGQIAKLLTGSR